MRLDLNILSAFGRFWFIALKLETKEETKFFWLRLLGSALVDLLLPYPILPFGIVVGAVFFYNLARNSCIHSYNET